MISDGYASTLKRLITFTQAKFISLADVVGYDVSYVNKWSNGTKLPSSRYVERINEEMGQYFAELIAKQKKEAKFFKAFPISGIRQVFSASPQPWFPAVSNRAGFACRPCLSMNLSPQTAAQTPHSFELDRHSSSGLDCAMVTPSSPSVERMRSTVDRKYRPKLGAIRKHPFKRNSSNQFR